MRWTYWHLDNTPNHVYRTNQPDMTATVYELWRDGHWQTLPGGNIVMDHLFGEGSAGVSQMTDVELAAFLADKAANP